MSMQARLALVNSSRTILDASQREDFLDVHKTNTNLVAFVLEMIGKGHIIQFTAVCSDHHNDLDLCPIVPHDGTHAAGYAADCWPLNSSHAGDWMSAQASEFQRFLRDAAQSPWLKQIGLAGEADTVLDELAAGRTWFPDDGASHVHFGVHA